MATDTRKPVLTRSARSSYERKKTRATARERAVSRLARDIGPIPPVADPARKARTLRSLFAFAESYFPKRFFLDWSDDHRAVIRRLEYATKYGGLFALAMPRGSGKTTLCEVTTIWAVLAGYRDFVMLICENRPLAEDRLGGIKVELSRNDRLLADYPEAVYPIRCLEGENRRSCGQLHHGQQTFARWGDREIVLPTIPGSRASGAVIRVAGMTSGVRGTLVTKPDGKQIGPSFVLLDDPQDDEIALNPIRAAKRAALINGAVLNMARPGTKMTAVMTCTKIALGDVADIFLDRTKSPDWQGETYRMMRSMPARMDLWDRYARLRRDEFARDGDGAEATEFYRKHRAAMDQGADAAWPARHNADEISGVQHAMNLMFRDEAAFWAEYQNEPRQDGGEADRLTVADVEDKTGGLPRRAVPVGCNTLTMFADVHDKLLYWCICAWADDFTGHVIDYGTWPEQKGRAYFTLRDARRTLGRKYPKTGREGAILAGLKDLLAASLDRTFEREDGAEMRLDRVLVDAGYLPRQVGQAIRLAGSAAVWPSRGVGIGAAHRPFSEHKRKKGERVGDNWMIPAVTGTQELRHVRIDTNHWKTFVHARLATALGDPGCLSLWGRDGRTHRLFADHVAGSEFFVVTESRGRKVQEWKTYPTRPDNHWFDCLVGCAVGASLCGITLWGRAVRRRGKKKRPKVTYIE